MDQLGSNDDSAQQTTTVRRPPSQILAKPGSSATEFVGKISSLAGDLRELVKKAEGALLTYLDIEKSSFSRLPIVGRKTPQTERASSVSNADAVIALETAPRTEGIWETCREDVIDTLADGKRASLVFRPESAYQSTRVAAALHIAGRHLSETLHASADINSTWPQLTVANILEHRGFAPDVGVMRPRPHACVNYWAVRALLAYEEDIRAIGVRLSRAVSTAVNFALHEIGDAQTRWRQHRDRFDATSYGFALATLWHRPGWLQDVSNPEPASELLARLFDAQRSDGTWRTARPLYVLGPRERIFSGPEDLCFAVFDQVEDLLDSGKLEPDDLLSERALGSIRRFVEWANETYCDSNVRIRSAGEPSLADGWASSAEPDAQGPECWGTAIVLRTAKAFLRAIECAASRAARDALAPPPNRDEESIPWADIALNRHVREVLDEPGLRSALLAGPPGTGKTTLIKSFAERSVAQRKNACASFVTIAPDYLTADGVDRLSCRLEHVFLLLPLLKDGVILFDEIDELLLEREGIAGESFSRLLTTAMLPRLQKLRKLKGGQGGIRFFVATNPVEKFDAAIVREGRFDTVLAVEPPDPEARCSHAIRVFGDTILGSEPARIVLFSRDDALLKTLLGPSIPNCPDWQKVAAGLYRYDGARLALADAMRLLVADATCARRNATYKLHYVSQLLGKTESEGQEPVDPAFMSLIEQTHHRIALLEDATYFQLINLLVMSLACRALRSASEQAAPSFLIHDVLEVLRAVSTEWSRLTSPNTDSDRALLLRTFEAVLDTARAARERLGEDPAEVRQRRAKGRRCLTTCGNLLGTPLEKFARYFEGRKQIEFFTPEEHRHDETRARRVLDSGRWDWMRGDDAFERLEKYLSSAEAQKLATLASAAAQHQSALREKVAGLRSYFAETHDEAAASQPESEPPSQGADAARGDVSPEGSRAVKMARKVIGDLEDTLTKGAGPSRLPTKDDRDALQAAVSRLALELPPAFARDAVATKLRERQSEFLAEICRHFRDFVRPIAVLVEEHAGRLVDLSKKMKESSRVASSVVAADFEKVAQSVNDAFAAYQPWRKAIRSVSTFMTVIDERGRLFGSGTVGRPPYAILMKRPESLRAECRARRIRVEECPPGELPTETLARISDKERPVVLAALHDEMEIIGAGRSSLRIGQVLWRSTELSELFERVVRDVLDGPWRESDKVLTRRVPYGLPNSGAMLLVGQGFSREDVERATKAVVDCLGLRDAEALGTILDDLKSGFDTKVASKIEERLHDAFADLSWKSKFYEEAATYEWELKTHKIDQSVGRELHPRAGTPFLSPDAVELLKHHPVLWAMRVDAEHDPPPRGATDAAHGGEVTKGR